ncbi:hypothetical protein T06_2721 [Trichinella sp. T6]|nr:hypothetical protein T06_2721 [Trichinella sp. T6]
MQIRIATTLPYHQMEQRKCENADDTKQNKRRQMHQRRKCRGIFCLSQVLFVMAFYRMVYILTEI